VEDVKEKTTLPNTEDSIVISPRVQVVHDGTATQGTTEDKTLLPSSECAALPLLPSSEVIVSTEAKDTSIMMADEEDIGGVPLTSAHKTRRRSIISALLHNFLNSMNEASASLR